MGILQSALSSLNSASFTGSLRANNFHQYFRAYSDVDLWSSYRSWRKMLNKTTLVKEEFFQLVPSLKPTSQLFLFDFLCENEVDIKVIKFFTLIAVFSGASLREKGRFLLAVNDRTARGVISCATLAQLIYEVVYLLERCMKCEVQAKQVKPSVKRNISKLLPSLAQVLRQNPDAYEKEQIITSNDIDTLVEEIAESYIKLPISDTRIAGKRKTLGREKQVDKSNFQTFFKPEKEDSPSSENPTIPEHQPSINFDDILPEKPRDMEIYELKQQLNRANAKIKDLEHKLLA
jgi:hypothetical protein